MAKDDKLTFELAGKHKDKFGRIKDINQDSIDLGVIGDDVERD